MADSGVRHIAHELLSRAHPPPIADDIFTDRVLRKPLIVRPTSPDPNSQDARSARRKERLRKAERTRRRQKPKPLSAKEKRMLDVYEIPVEQQRYEIYEPLHRLWVGYMWEILGLKEGEGRYVAAEAVGPKLVSADFHGAEMQVVSSKCVGRIGCKGIVLKDTKFTFVVVTRENSLRTIPKKGSNFRFEIPRSLPQERPFPQEQSSVQSVANSPEEKLQVLPALAFEIRGSQFENRATDRATRKFKQRRLDAL